MVDDREQLLLDAWDHLEAALECLKHIPYTGARKAGLHKADAQILGAQDHIFYLATGWYPPNVTGYDRRLTRDKVKL